MKRSILATLFLVFAALVLAPGWPTTSNTYSGENAKAAEISGATELYLPSLFRPLRTTTVRISDSYTGAQGNGLSHDPSIPADGRFVTFTSDASNMMPNDLNGVADIFVHDRETGQRSLSRWLVTEPRLMIIQDCP